MTGLSTSPNGFTHDVDGFRLERIDVGKSLHLLLALWCGDVALARRWRRMNR